MVQLAGLQPSAPPRHSQRFFVADFIGSTNLVPGEIVGSPDARALLTVRSPAGDAVVRPSPVRTGAVLLAIRLHRQQLAAPGSEWPKVNAWTAHIGRINDLGGRLQVVPHLSAKTELVVDVVNSTAFTFR